MWFCPTYQRPERLAHLAMSWQAMEKGTPLKVRIVDSDPRKDEYLACTWPKGWELFVSPTVGLGDALAEFFAENNASINFGFIADDIVLRSRRGLEKLERLAEDWYLAYPSDTVHRNLLCTHFCVGGELARTVGGMVIPGFRHLNLDQAWMMLGQSTGILRYAADVIFEHQHWINGKAEVDEVYAVRKEEDFDNPKTEDGKHDRQHLQWLLDSGELEGLHRKIVRARGMQFEHPEAWQAMDRAWAGQL